MSTPDEKLIDRLNSLLSVCNDGKYGYKTAADKVASQELKAQLLALSKIRAGFVNTLCYEIQKAGGNPVTSGDPSGTLHRAWISVKSILPSKDKGILEACVTGDRAALSVYQEILTDALLPTDVRSHINVQFVSIKSAIKKLELLSEAIV